MERAASVARSRSTGFDPAAQHASDFGDHAADVLVLAIIKPLPAMSQPEIQTQLVQLRIGRTQVLLAGCSALAHRIKDRLLKVERGIDQTLSDRQAIDFWKLL